MPTDKDEVSKMLLRYISKEQSVEDCLDLLKTDFRKKRLTLDQYL